MEKKEINNLLVFLSESVKLTEDQINSLEKFSVKIDKDFKSLINYCIHLDNSLLKIKEFTIKIPLDYKGKYSLKKFVRGQSYKVILWNVNITSKNSELHEKLEMENCFFGGREGLNILCKLVPDIMPQNKQIFSFRTEINRDVPCVTIHNYFEKKDKIFSIKDFEDSLLFSERKMSHDSIVVSFEKK